MIRCNERLCVLQQMELCDSVESVRCEMIIVTQIMQCGMIRKSEGKSEGFEDVELEKTPYFAYIDITRFVLDSNGLFFALHFKNYCNCFISKN